SREFKAATGEFRHAIEIDPKYAVAHNNLGRALRELGEIDAAISECRRALELIPDNANSLVNLRSALELKGEFAEALAATRRFHELGGGRPNWPYPSGQWMKEAELLADLDARLRGLLVGTRQVKAGE